MNKANKEENVRSDYFCERDFMLVIMNACLGKYGMLNLEFNGKPLDGYHFYLDSMRQWTVSLSCFIRKLVLIVKFQDCIEKSVPGLLDRKAAFVPSSSSIKVTKANE